MEALEVLDLISKGETSQVQLKENITNVTKLAQELAAFTNSEGGIIIVGVRDSDWSITGLSNDDLRRLGSMVATAANDHIKEPIYPATEVISLIDEEGNAKNVLLIKVEEGTGKPYTDKDGVVWVKSASDKRKVTSPEELSRLLQSGRRYYADKAPIHDAGLDDFDLKAFGDYFKKVYDQYYTEIDTPIQQLLSNQNLYKDGHPTLAGLLLFGKRPEQKLPNFIIKCVRFTGNDIAGTQYLDSEDMKGTIQEQFKNTMAFLSRNLIKEQGNQDFNSQGKWIVSKLALQEIVQNAIIHRNYFKNSPIRVFMFNDRIEIISPGKLPNSLTIENIRFGQSVARNNTLISFASNMLPYRGIGSGIRRALKEEPDMDLINDTEGEQFIVKFPIK